MSSLEPILAALGIIVGWLVRSYPQWRREWLQAKMAQAELDHPLGTNDPRVAAQNALLSVERKRVDDVVRRLAGPVPRLGSQSEKNGDDHKTPPAGTRRQ